MHYDRVASYIVHKQYHTSLQHELQMNRSRHKIERSLGIVHESRQPVVGTGAEAKAMSIARQAPYSACAFLPRDTQVFNIINC